MSKPQSNLNDFTKNILNNEQLQFLPEIALEQVLEFVEGLNLKHFQKPIGVPGNQLLQFAGTILSDDLQLMAEAIELSCNQVDFNEW